MNVTCPECFWEFDITPDASKDRVQCTCPMCTHKFVFNLHEADEDKKEDKKTEEEKATKEEIASVVGSLKGKPENEGSKKEQPTGGSGSATADSMPTFNSLMKMYEQQLKEEQQQKSGGGYSRQAPAPQPRPTQHKKVFCQDCGTEFSDNAFVCKVCGAPRPGYIFCPECGEIVKETSNYCLNCGCPLPH